ncbi:hypothetical protein C5F53_04960 [Rhodoferax sp. TS-BS-61-7]|nr:hypothetical protein C5F53_04960 [Rhodoferax sp. TS-BS-61-7]
MLNPLRARDTPRRSCPPGREGPPPLPHFGAHPCHAAANERVGPPPLTRTHHLCRLGWVTRFA